MHFIKRITDDKNKLILVILYIGFFSLALPEHLLGLAWPFMMLEFSKSLDKAGVILSLATFTSAVTAYLSIKFIRKYNIFSLLTSSMLIYCIGILGYAISSGWFFILFSTIWCAIGIGILSPALNNYVSSNYEAYHLNWLYGVGTIGVTAGPMLMTLIIALKQNWRLCYLIIFIIQFLLVFLFLATKKYWKTDIEYTQLQQNHNYKITKDIFFSMSFFFIYTSIESSLGLWFFSYMVFIRNFSPALAAFFISSYAVSLTIMRFMSVWTTKFISNKNIISIGILISFMGLIFIGFDNKILCLLGLIIIGIGFSGIFPGMINETHKRFPQEYVPFIISHQIGSTYLGYAILTPFIGFILQRFGLEFLKSILIMLIIILGITDLRLRRLSV